MEKTLRELHILSATRSVRVAKYDGRDHLVVPVVALMEGVIHAINAETPEFVPMEALSAAPHTWDGRPIMLGHPTIAGKQVSANTAQMMESHAFGQIFNTKVQGNKLLCEAWIDPIKAEKIGAGDVVRKIRAGEMTEVSVGAFVATDGVAGTHNGKTYKARWQSISPDHLAFLPNGRGACSIEMGCGAMRTAAGWHAFVGKDVKFVAAAASGMEAPGEEEAELVGYQTLQALFAQVGSLYDEGSALVDALLADELDETVTDEAAETAVERARLSALSIIALSMLSQLNAIVSHAGSLFAPVAATGVGSPLYLEAFRSARAAQRADDTQVIRAAHQALHEMHEYTGALGEPCEGSTTFHAAESARSSAMNRTQMLKTLSECGCHGLTAAQLEASSDEQLTALSSMVEAAAKVTALEAENATLRAAAEAAPKALTEAEFMAAAPPSIRALIEAKQAEDAARHAELVTSLKTAQSEFTEDELKAMPLAQLDRLGRVVKVETPSYAGRAVPRVASEHNAVSYAAPDSYAEALAARKVN